MKSLMLLILTSIIKALEKKIQVLRQAYIRYIEKVQIYLMGVEIDGLHYGIVFIIFMYTKNQAKEF